MGERLLDVIVPTRGRPGNILPLLHAWRQTGAPADGARLWLVLDVDDPQYGAYRALMGGDRLWLRHIDVQTWRPLVPKLNLAALHLAGARDAPPLLGFAGDDHIPVTPGWVERMATAALRRPPAIVYGNDRVQGSRLPTSWVMTTDIVTALGAMVPCTGLEHLYCDNVIKDLGQRAGCLHYLSTVIIEHRHPITGRVATDEQYRRVNSPEQYARDQAAYTAWCQTSRDEQVHQVRALRKEVVS